MIKLIDILTSDEVKELNALKVTAKGKLALPKHIRTKMNKATKGRALKISKNREYLV